MSDSRRKSQDASKPESDEFVVGALSAGDLEYLNKAIGEAKAGDDVGGGLLSRAMNDAKPSKAFVSKLIRLFTPYTDAKYKEILTLDNASKVTTDLEAVGKGLNDIFDKEGKVNPKFSDVLPGVITPHFASVIKDILSIAAESVVDEHGNFRPWVENYLGKDKLPQAIELLTKPVVMRQLIGAMRMKLSYAAIEAGCYYETIYSSESVKAFSAFVAFVLGNIAANISSLMAHSENLSGYLKKLGQTDQVEQSLLDYAGTLLRQSQENISKLEKNPCCNIAADINPTLWAINNLFKIREFSTGLYKKYVEKFNSFCRTPNFTSSLAFKEWIDSIQRTENKVTLYQNAATKYKKAQNEMQEAKEGSSIVERLDKQSALLYAKLIANEEIEKKELADFTNVAVPDLLTKLDALKKANTQVQSQPLKGPENSKNDRYQSVVKEYEEAKNQLQGMIEIDFSPIIQKLDEKAKVLTELSSKKSDVKEANLEEHIASLKFMSSLFAFKQAEKICREDNPKTKKANENPVLSNQVERAKKALNEQPYKSVIVAEAKNILDATKAGYDELNSLKKRVAELEKEDATLHGIGSELYKKGLELFRGQQLESSPEARLDFNKKLTILKDAFSSIVSEVIDTDDVAHIRSMRKIDEFKDFGIQLNARMRFISTCKECKCVTDSFTNDILGAEWKTKIAGIIDQKYKKMSASELHALCDEIEEAESVANALNKLNEVSRITEGLRKELSTAAKATYEAGVEAVRELFKTPAGPERSRMIMQIDSALTIAASAVQHPSKDYADELIVIGRSLPGKAMSKLAGALLYLAGVISLVLGLALSVPTFGAGGIAGTTIAGKLFIAGSAAWYHGREKGLCKAVTNLGGAVEKSSLKKEQSKPEDEQPLLAKTDDSPKSKGPGSHH